MNKRPSYRTLAIFFAATFLPAAMTVGGLVGGIVKLINPNNVDVWQPLAYLGHALISGIVTFIALLVLALIYIVLIAKQEKSLKLSAKLPIIVVLVNLLLVVGMLAGQSITKTAEDNWARAHNQMTHEERDAQMDVFFRQLNEQNQQN